MVLMSEGGRDRRIGSRRDAVGDNRRIAKTDARSRQIGIRREVGAVDRMKTPLVRKSW